MSEELRLALMGGLQLTLGATDLTHHLPVKAQALLCYLAMSGHSYPRQELVGQFWGDSPEEKARGSLRVALTKMRQQDLSPYLVSTRDALTFNRQSVYRLDVEAFENCLERGRDADTAARCELLRQAVDLYRGDFLDGFIPDDALGFEEWMLAQRERLRRLALSALDELVQYYVEQEAYDPGIEYANRLLVLDPWRESAHRQLMWLLARTDQRSAAIAQYETCRELLLNELGLEPDEETKKLYEQIRAMELMPARSTRPLPPVTGTEDDDAAPFQAPARVVHFMNREREVARFRTALMGVEGRKVYGTTGMGGVGKTSLAIHLAHALRDDFSDGVLWADAASSDPMVIAENWAQAYGYDFTGLSHFEERMAALRALLEDKQALLVLDDVIVASRVRPLLPDSDKCAVLITTRNVELAYALNARPIDLKELTPQYGRHLLAELIGEARASADETAVAAICQLLQNLPLALTIAGAYLNFRPYRPLADFARQLQDESNRLNLEVADRQVRASFAVSWQALDETQRRVFSLLAVFEGRSFTAEALAAVAEMPLFLAQERLYALVNLSLLGIEEGRFRQHALLADFAREQLGEAPEAYGRMARYFLNHATEHQRDYDALRPEWENLSAGIRVAHRLGLWQTVIDYTGVLRDAWFARGRYSEAREAFRWAYDAATMLASKPALARILLHWGCACIEQNDYDEAKELLLASLRLHQELDDQAGIAATLYHLARIALEQANYEEAERLLAESQHLREQLDDTFGVAETLFRQVRLRYQQGDYNEARQLAEKILGMQEAISDKLGTVRTLRFLAIVLLQLEGKEYDLAERYCQSALELCRELQDQTEFASTLQALSSVHRAQGKLSLARDHAQESLKLLKSMGDRRTQAIGLYRLSLIYFDMKTYEDALETSYQSLNLCLELQDDLGSAFVRQLLGDILHKLGRRERASEMWRSALDIAQKLQHAQLIHVLRERLGGHG